MLRQFLYMDRDLVREFLAQLEGGIYDESRETTTAGGKRGVKANVGGGPVSAGVDRANSTQAESEAVVKQTSASEFDRLYTRLESAGLQVYDVIDEKIDELPIRRKDIIEFDARLHVSGLQTVLDLASTFGQLLPLMESLSATPDLDPDAVQSMQALAALGTVNRSIPIIATVPGECSLRIALELKADGVQTDDWNTEATLILKVQRLLRPGDRHVVGDPFGGLMKMLPETQRHQLLASLKSEELSGLGVGEAEIAYPGIVGTAIGIFR